MDRRVKEHTLGRILSGGGAGLSAFRQLLPWPRQGRQTSQGDGMFNPSRRQQRCSYLWALHFQEALRLEPDFIAARCNLGDVLRGFGRNAEAIVQYGEVLRREPGSAEIQNNMGLALMGMSRFREAAAHFREALRLDPNLAEAHTNLAKALARIRTRD